MSHGEQTTSSITAADANGVLRLALQRSEPRRLFLLFATLACGLTLNLIRHFTGGKVMQGQTYILRLVLLGAIATYAIALLIAVRRANRESRVLPFWVSVASTFIEAAYPTIALFIVVVSSRVSPIEALSGPSILLYAIVIVLSILRMRPMLCAICGLICSSGHAFLIFWAVAKMGASVGTGGWPVIASYPVYLLVAGVAATFISFELRNYFRASLREADARRRLDMVEREVEIARSVQQSLLPEKPPIVEGFDIAGWNRPADRTGGDYYDWQELPDGRLAVIIADVSGHGLGPALIMAVCRAYARACVPIGPGLGIALERINSLLHDDVQDGRFVTFAVVILDPRSGQCELLSAGHGPILLYHARDKRVEEFNGDGIPLGLMANEEYGQPRSFQMVPGDALVLVTDGFLEWARQSDGEMFGVQRVCDCLLTHAKASAIEIIELLDQGVRDFGGDSPQKDDMTAVVIRRK